MNSSSQVFLEPYFEYKKFLEFCSKKNYSSSLVVHKHHIIPTHMGGDSSKNNLVDLSVTDHIKAHLLLSECFEEKSYERVANLQSARLLNRSSIKRKKDMSKISEAYLGENNPFYGKKHSMESLIPGKEFNKKKFKGKSFDEIYGERSLDERAKRKNSVKRHWESLTEEERKERRQNMSRSSKGKALGAKNPASFPLLIGGKRYECLKEALNELGISRFKLYKYYDVIKLEKK